MVWCGGGVVGWRDERGVDTAIVGAGIVGLATAHALCRDGAGSVALFDRSWPGSGDSGRSFSMVRRHYSNAVVARLAIEGSRTIRDWAGRGGGGRRRATPAAATC